jgi:predicted metal-dependent hydrolase
MTSSANNSANQTPVDVRPRRMNFPYSELKKKYFFDDNLLKSAYIAAMSATFPGGEAEFIESVRLFRDKIDDKELQEQIRGFIGQEGHHSHQHRLFNKTLTDMGLDAVGIEDVFQKDLERTLKGRTERERLAFTACFEHQTAILSEEILTNPEFLKGMDPTIKSLMEWHAVEEIEHKGVAFDVYMETVGDRKLLFKAQRIATVLFQYRVTKYMVIMMWRARAMPSWKDVKGYLKFMFGKNGLIRNLRKPYKDFFREDFHPWDHQNQGLIEEWKQNRYTAEFDRGSEQYKLAS